MSRLRIEGSRVLITGAGSGIGKATALCCAERGAAVVATDIDGAAAQGTADSCAALGAVAHAYACDVADSAAVAALAREVDAALGPVDVLVNDAGVAVAGPFLDNSLQDWEWLRGVNLDGVVHCCAAFGRPMLERRHGHIVNIGSAAGYIASRDLAAYCATKAAVIMHSRCLRADWAASGVGVSVICPGFVRTPIPLHSRMVGALAGKHDEAMRLFRYGHSPDLVAKAVVDAVHKNRAVVTVGLGATVAIHVLRFAPTSLQGRLARVQVI